MGSCSAGAQVSTITLTNSNSATVTAYFLAEYSLDGGSNWTSKASNQSVAVNSSETLTQSVSHGSAITWRYKTSSTSNSFSGDYTTLSESSTVDCDPNSTITSSFGSVLDRVVLKLPLSIRNNEGSTAYYKIEYSTDGGSSFTTLSSNLSIASGGTDQSQSVAVSHGSTIIWRVTDSLTSGDFTNMSTETQSESSAVDCDPDSTATQSLGACSSGSAVSTLSITNNESVTVYYKVEYSTDGGSTFTEAVSDLTITAGSTNSSQTLSLSAGETVIWRYKDTFEYGSYTGGSFTTLSESSQVLCTDVSVAQSFGSCASGSQTSTFAITNGASANTAAYVKVEYSLDGGTNWTSKASNQSVAANSTENLTQTVSDGGTITWRYEVSLTSNNIYWYMDRNIIGIFCSRL